MNGYSDGKKRMVYRSNATNHDHGVMVSVIPTAASKVGMGWILQLDIVLSLAVTHQSVAVQPTGAFVDYQGGSWGEI